MNIKKIIKKVLNESVEKPLISEHLNYHVTNDIPLNDNIFRFGSEEFFNVINEARELYFEGMVELNEDDVELVESDFGKQVKLSSGRVIYLDTPMEEEFISEAEYNGKKVIPSIIQAFADNNYDYNKVDKDGGFDYLFAFNGNIFRVACDLSFFQANNGAYGIGSGGQFALGYLSSIIKPNMELEYAKRHARKAVEIASVLDANTGKPLQLVVQERM